MFLVQNFRVRGVGCCFMLHLLILSIVIVVFCLIIVYIFLIAWMNDNVYMA
jgi:hypothetical protein